MCVQRAREATSRDLGAVLLIVGHVLLISGAFMPPSILAPDVVDMSTPRRVGLARMARNALATVELSELVHVARGF